MADKQYKPAQAGCLHVMVRDMPVDSWRVFKKACIDAGCTTSEGLRRLVAAVAHGKVSLARSASRACR